MNTVTIAQHELERLIKADRMLAHLLTNCSYLEDGVGKVGHTACWSSDDDERQCMSLRDYLEIRIAGHLVPDTIEKETGMGELCPCCDGSGEGMYDGSICHKCDGHGEVA